MAKDYNLTIITGRLGRNAEIKATKQGKELVEFSCAVNNYKGETIWFKCVSFAEHMRKLAADSYLTSGKQVLVTGELSVRAYVNKKGEAVAEPNIMIKELQLLGSKEDKPAQPSRQEMRELSTDGPLDDIPF